LKIQKYFLIVVLLSSFLFQACKKDEVKPPSGNSRKDFVWQEKISVADIPDAPIKGFLRGKELKIDYVNFEKWRGSGDNVINFGDKKPSQLCGYVENDNAVSLLHKSGDIPKGEFTKTSFDANMDGYIADYHYTEKDNMKKTSPPWNCALFIEEINGETVKGKIAICFKDDSKSWIAGRFEAVICSN
jgi:hypothetical protein